MVGTDVRFIFHLAAFSLGRSCCHCSLNVDDGLMLCQHCRRQVLAELKKRKVFWRKEGDLNHSYLLRWGPQDDLISNLVYALKGGPSPATFRWLAELLVIFANPSLIKEARIVFPSKGKKDHAFQLARALGQFLGLEYQPLYLKRQENRRLNLLPKEKAWSSIGLRSEDRFISLMISLPRGRPCERPTKRSAAPGVHRLESVLPAPALMA